MNIMVLFGSSRAGRRGGELASWVASEVRKREGCSVDFVDCRDLNLPFFDEIYPVDALDGNFRHPEGKAWDARVASADGFIIVTPEYNRGIPAILKNAIDYAWSGWNYKPVSIVGYSNGPWGGTRAIEQLKLNMIGVRAWPLPTTLPVPGIGTAFTDDGDPLDQRVENGLSKLIDEQLMIAAKLRS